MLKKVCEHRFVDGVIEHSPDKNCSVEIQQAHGNESVYQHITGSKFVIKYVEDSDENSDNVGLSISTVDKNGLVRGTVTRLGSDFMLNPERERFELMDPRKRQRLGNSEEFNLEDGEYIYMRGCEGRKSSIDTEKAPVTGVSSRKQ